MYNMQQSEATDWRSDIGNVCIWKLTHCGGHEWHSECSDSVSDIIKGHIIEAQALCVLHISMCCVPSAGMTNNGPIVFQPPTWVVYQSKCDTLSPVCFPLCSVPLLFWAVTGFFVVVFYRNLYFFYVLPTLLKGPAWVYILLMLVWSSWWGSKPWVDQPAWCFWWSWLTLLDKINIHPKNENGPTSDGFKPVWPIFFCGSQSYLGYYGWMDGWDGKTI